MFVERTVGSLNDRAPIPKNKTWSTEELTNLNHSFSACFSTNRIKPKRSGT